MRLCQCFHYFAVHMSCDICALFFMQKLPCRTCQIPCALRRRLVYQNIFMVAEQLVIHSVVSGDPLLGAGPRPQSSGEYTYDTSGSVSGFLLCGIPFRGQPCVIVLFLIQG